MSKILSTAVIAAGIVMWGNSAQAALLVDFDASSGVLHTGGLVDSWTPIVGGAARIATPPGASNSPTIASSVFAQGQPGVFFDATDNLLAFSDAEFPAGAGNSPEWTMVGAFRYAAGINNHASPMGWGRDDATNNHNQMGFGRWNNDGKNLRTATNGSGAMAGELVMEADVNYVVIISHASGNDEIDFTLIDNGVATTQTVAHDFADPWAAEIKLESGYIGNLVSPSSPEFDFFKMNGHVGRVLVYDNAVTGAARTALINELSGYTLIPEPATVTLLGLGALVLLRRRRG
jgi:hypothetical protein